MYVGALCGVLVNITERGSEKLAAARNRTAWLAGVSIFLLCAFFSYIFCLRPSWSRLNRLGVEKEHWLAVLSQFSGGETGTGIGTKVPTLAELPGLVESCRRAFLTAGVHVESLSVERFGETAASTPQKVDHLDYALLRLQWTGSWPAIEQALSGLERDQSLGIGVREVHLRQGGGEGLLQVYFRHT
ncbi:hypothetical protein CEB3_c45930 [Peptococcaceae bacterium CEB3]|nr:hypothetical protein CEB3_c45930 [Peptococcaceae bacterium CEB3]